MSRTLPLIWLALTHTLLDHGEVIQSRRESVPFNDRKTGHVDEAIRMSRETSPPRNLEQPLVTAP